ncbi:MAG: alpha-1,4-glucan--maltose-1-phosphate maltosyltransferase, partial [Algibacter sp.]
SSIGIYGPVFEYMLSESLLGKEEYLNSEKFQITHYNWEIKNKLITIIAKINYIRHNNPALQQTNNIKFCHIGNDNLLAFYKWNDDRTNQIFVIISLDSHNSQQGTVQVPLHDIGVHHGHNLEMHDLITDSRYNWNSEWCFVELHPTMPFHIFKINK